MICQTWKLLGAFRLRRQYCSQLESEKGLRDLAAAKPLPNPTSRPCLEAAAPQVETPPVIRCVQLLSGRLPRWGIFTIILWESS